MPTTDETGLPAYQDLPRLEDIGSNHSWGVFGDDDNFGALNLYLDFINLFRFLLMFLGARR